MKIQDTLTDETDRKLPISCLDMGIGKSEGVRGDSYILQEIDGNKTLAFTK